MPLIIPQFHLSQDDKYLKVLLRLPYVKVQKSEFSISGKHFSFYLKPYLLKLELEQDLKDVDVPAKCQYDVEKHELLVLLEKLNYAEEFTNLNMISLIMQKKQVKPAKRKRGNLIQVIDSQENVVESGQTQMQQSQGDLPLNAGHKNQFQYGFDNFYADVFDDLEEELLEIAILDPKDIAFEDRVQLLKKFIKQSFDKDVYIYDLLENEQVDEILDFKVNMAPINLTIEEINVLSKLQKREFLIDDQDRVSRGIVDILFAYYYEHQVMFGELSSESGITINRCSSLFSCFGSASSLQEQLFLNYGCCLAFPMVRSFELCVKTQGIVAQALRNKICVLKAFLSLFTLFSKCKPREYLNIVFLEDYLVYLQQMAEGDLEKLGKLLEACKVKKGELDLELDKIEAIAIHIAYQNEQTQE